MDNESTISAARRWMRKALVYAEACDYTEAARLLRHAAELFDEEAGRALGTTPIRKCMG